jgi:hypothetical protein
MRHLRQRRTAWLALFALALQVLFQAHCRPAMAAAGGMPICTPSGVIYLPPASPDAPAQAPHDCPACQAGHCGSAFAAPEAVAIALPVERPAERSLLSWSVPVLARLVSNALARGPPLAG